MEVDKSTYYVGGNIHLLSRILDYQMDRFG